MQGDIHHQEGQEDEEGGINCAKKPMGLRICSKEMFMNVLGQNVLDDNISDVNENNVNQTILMK